MIKLRLLFSGLLIFVGLSTVFAQASIDFNAPIPNDPSIRTGKLPNGLTYYIKKNTLPANRAEFYIVTNAGAIQETPAQNGLAHFTEHMCFNGTKNFHKKDIINYLQSIGMKFGPEINAYTVHDETVYTLNKVPIETKANIDTSLMILFDWACNVSFDKDEIDAERGVVGEEWRTRGTAQFRLSTKMYPLLFANSKYATHDVIGKLDIIQNAPYDTIIKFYKDWYRPDLQAVVVVGDIDVDQIEAKIKERFSSLPVHPNAPKREVYQIPNHKETLIGIEKDKEATYTMLQVFYKHEAKKDRNVGYYYASYKEQLYSTMINARLGEKVQSANPPFVYAMSAYSGLVRTKEAYYSIAILQPDNITLGIKELAIENERVKQFGFQATELERAKKQMLSSVEKSYNERNKKESEDVARTLQSNFLDQEPIPSDEWDYEFAKKAIESITLAEMNALAKQWITDENRVIYLTGPDTNTIVYPTKEEVLAIFDNVKNEKILPYEDKVANRPLIAKTPVAGTIVKETIDKKNNVYRWELSNGVKVVIKPTNFKDDEILMSAQSNGGQYTYGAKDDISASIAAEIVDMSGLGDFDNIELQKALSGKMVSISPFIGPLTEGFNGNSSIADFETLLQLNYLYFTAPRADKDAFESYMKRTKTSLQNKSMDPTSAFRDSISTTMAQHNPRKRPMTASLLDEAKLARIKFIFSDRFGDPSGFTYYFVGNINPDSAKATILTYLGGLPTVKRTETFTDLGIRIPKKNVSNVYQRKLEVPKATVFMGFTGDFKYTIEERLMMDAIAEYLNIRMTETLREEVGGTYGAGVWVQSNRYPAAEYSLNIYFDTDPNKLDTMISVVYREVKKVINGDINPTHIQNTVENKIKEHVEKVKENRYYLSTLKNDDFLAESYINYDYEKFWKNLNAKAVQKAAKKYLSTDRVVKVVTSSQEIK